MSKGFLMPYYLCIGTTTTGREVEAMICVATSAQMLNNRR